MREYLGYDNTRPDFPPLNYPSTSPQTSPILTIHPIISFKHDIKRDSSNDLVPNRPRFPPKGFEDPSPSELEPTWYRHVPPAPVRAALEKAGINWEDALRDLEARRDAMVLGNEWDVSLENGKVVWNKPSEATLKKRIETEQEFMDWGVGWRKGVVYLIWKVLGSPEGVFEYEGGKVDGKLVLRDLRKEKREGGKFKEEEKKEAK